MAAFGFLTSFIRKIICISIFQFSISRTRLKHVNEIQNMNEVEESCDSIFDEVGYIKVSSQF